MKPTAHLASLLLAVVIPASWAWGAADLTIQRPADYQVLQRVDGTADVPIVLAAGPEGAVQARVLAADKPVLDWQPCGQARAAEAFAGKLTKVPQGGWYAIEVRVLDQNKAPVASGRVAHVGVGIVVGIIGQSNASGYSGPEPYATPHPLTSVFRPCGLFELLKDPVCQPGPQQPLTDAQKADPALQPYLRRDPNFLKQTEAYLDWNCSFSAWPTFTGALAERYGVPVMVVPGPRGASSSEQWLPGKQPTSLYGHMIQQVQRAGGTLSAMVVIQGEQDCNKKEPGAKEWTENTRKYVSAFRQDLAEPNLPFFFVQIGAYNTWAPSLRQAIDQFTQHEPRCYLGGCALDFGGIHYPKEGMTTLGVRLARAYRNVAGGESNLVYQGPRAVSAELNADKTTLTIRFDHPIQKADKLGGVEILGDKDVLDLSSLATTGEEWSAAAANKFDAANRNRKLALSSDGLSLTVDLGALPPGTSLLTVRYTWWSDVPMHSNWGWLKGADEPHLPAYPFQMKVKVP